MFLSMNTSVGSLSHHGLVINEKNQKFLLNGKQAFLKGCLYRLFSWINTVGNRSIEGKN